MHIGRKLFVITTACNFVVLYVYTFGIYLLLTPVYLVISILLFHIDFSQKIINLQTAAALSLIISIAESFLVAKINILAILFKKDFEFFRMNDSEFNLFIFQIILFSICNFLLIFLSAKR